MLSVFTEKPVVSFWGTRGSISTPGRITEKYGGNTPCVSFQYRNTFVILDAGTGIRNLGIELGEMLKAEGGEKLSLHLLLSHTHWDHIQGLPFFVPAFMKGTKLTICGDPGKEAILDGILRGQMAFDYFPVDMSAFETDLTIKGIAREGIQLDGVRVDWEEQTFHPGGCLRFKLTAGGKSVVYASDVELDIAFRPKEETPQTRAAAERYMDFIRGTDLLIADGQYTGDEYKVKAGWGHTSIPLLLEVAHKAGVRQLAVFHHDPTHSDKFLDEQWMAHRSTYAKASPPMNVFWAREGVTLPA